MALVPLGWALFAGASGGGGAAGAPGGKGARFGRAFRLGFLAGFVFFLGLLYWIPKLPPENVTVPFLLYPALVLAAAYLALYVGLWAGGTVLLSRGHPARAALVGPGLWTLIEALRGSGIIGFPWGSLGYSQWDNLPFIQFAAIGGLWSVSLWIVLVNGCLLAWALGSGGRRHLWLAATALLFLVPWLHGRAELSRLAGPSPGRPVLLIQPNTGNDKWEPNRRTQVITHLAQMTIEAAADAPESTLVIWPETATPTLLKWDPPHMALVDQVAAAVRRPLLTGFPDRVLDWPEGERGRSRARYYNAAGLWRPGEGLVEQSAKRQLVPFAEWMPIPGLNRVNFGQGNFTPAESLHVFRQGGAPFGVLICFESIFPSLARDLVRQGALFLVNVTNDQWFGRSAAPWQHLTMAVFRAIENRVSIARAANTGVSGFIDPTGAIRRATPIFEPAVVAGEVALRTGPPTFYNRFGDWVLFLAAALVAAGAFPGGRGGRSPGR